jgi:sigma-B regulation protein RsbU (phosphoserine phosphatase)
MAFVLADVSGKGVPAALLMANLQAWFRSQPPGALEEPAALLERVNRHFYESTEANRFATLFYGLYHGRTRQLRYVNCAHPAPLVARASGALERLEPTATVVGAFANWSCAEASLELGAGDMLTLFSDGVTEAGGEGDEEFGEQRLMRTISENRQQAAGTVVDAVVDAVTDFSRGARSDDITVMVLRGL